MATEFKVRRGTTAEHAAFTGAEGEITLDTNKDTLVVHDNYQAGGYPMLREDLNNLANNSVGISKIESGTQGDILYYNASGQLAKLGAGNSGDVLMSGGSGANPYWVPNKVVNYVLREFNTQTAYGGSGVHMSVYDTTITDLTPGNKIFYQIQFFGEAQHDMAVQIYRQNNSGGSSGYLLQGVDGTRGRYTPGYDENQDSTPNLGTMFGYDTVPANTSSITYRIYKTGNTDNWWVNRCYNGGNEDGVTTIMIWELAP